MEALKRLSSWCPCSITLETDKVINRCYEFGSIIRKCRELMLPLLTNDNCVSYELARSSHFYASPVYFNNTPTCITNLVMNEMT